MRHNIKIDFASLHLYFLLVAFMGTGLWGNFYFTPFSVMLALCLVVAYLSWELSRTSSVNTRPWQLCLSFPPKSEWSLGTLFWGLAVLSFATISLILTARSEFPFVTDANWHLGLSLDAIRGFKHQIILLLVLGIISYIARSHLSKLWVPLALTLFLWALSYLTFFSLQVRYPTGFYFIAAPFNFVSNYLRFPYVLLVNRVINLSAFFLWLFVFRPLFLEKLPSKSLLLCFSFSFLQPRVIFYLTSSYIEPWALMFLLLGTELVFEQSKERRTLGILFVGLAAVFKEQIILALPFFWFAAFHPWRSEPMRAVITGITAGLPFLAYYGMRNRAQIFRVTTHSLGPEMLNLLRMREFFSQLHHDVGKLGLVAISLTCFLILVLFVKTKKYRLTLVCCALASICQVAFFFLDGVSSLWTGYYRFHLVPIMLASVILIIFYETFCLSLKTKQVLYLLSGLMAVLHSPSLIDFIKLNTKPAWYSNGWEVMSGPLYLPLREILTDVEKSGKLDRINEINISLYGHSPYTNGYIPRMMDYFIGRAYPDFSNKIKFSVNLLENRDKGCRCVSMTEAKMAFFLPDLIYQSKEISALAVEKQKFDRCQTEIESSCFFQEKLQSGPTDFVGLLGIKTPLTVTFVP